MADDSVRPRGQRTRWTELWDGILVPCDFDRDASRYRDWRQRSVRHGIEMTSGFGLAGLAWISASNTFVNGIQRGVVTHPSPITWELCIRALGIVLGALFLLAGAWGRMPWPGKTAAIRADQRALEESISHAVLVSNIHIRPITWQEKNYRSVEYEVTFENGRHEPIVFEILSWKGKFDSCEQEEVQSGVWTARILPGHNALICGPEIHTPLPVAGGQGDYAGRLEYIARYGNIRGGRKRILHQDLKLRLIIPDGAEWIVRWEPVLNEDEWEGESLSVKALTGGQAFPYAPSADGWPSAGISNPIS